MTELPLAAIFRCIDQLNDADPNRIEHDGRDRGAAWLYGERMSRQLAEFAPQASAPLQVAVRAQHLERWIIPRDRYPMTRQGYHQWRQALAQHHADRAAGLLRQNRAPEDCIAQVARLLRKQGLKTDPDTQTLEDVACLVFLQHYLADFSQKHPDDKLVDIIRKTWRKMSSAGQQAALALPLPDPLSQLVAKALN